MVENWKVRLVKAGNTIKSWEFTQEFTKVPDIEDSLTKNQKELIKSGKATVEMDYSAIRRIK